MDYKQDLYIDKNRLDEEWLNQPMLMAKYNTMHAQAMLDRDRAKQALDVLRANLDSSIRASLAAQNAKFTEAVVDGRIKSSQEYIGAQEVLFQADNKVNTVFGAVMAFQARKAALENLVKLWLSSYWASPKAPDVISEQAYDAESARIHSALQEAMPQESMILQHVKPTSELARPLKLPKPIRRP